MPAAYFVAPYKLRPNDKGRPFPIRYCAMDDHTAAIDADGGCWSEVEIAGDQAVVVVEASAKTLATLAGEFEQVDREAAARRIADEPRRTPRLVDGEIVFDGPVVAAAKRGTIDRLDAELARGR